MGFGIKQQHLLKNLEKLRKQRCAYLGERCDCKYLKDEEDADFHYLDETNGCPEIRMAAAMLAALSEEEFNELAKKSGIIITT